MAQASISRTGELQQQRIEMERRSKELESNMRKRREGLHVEQAADLMDSLQLAADREFEMEQLTRESEELSLVQRAIDTLDAGSYGLCIECENRISPKRLQVMPWAVRCISCQQTFEESSGSTDDSDSLQTTLEPQS